MRNEKRKIVLEMSEMLMFLSRFSDFWQEQFQDAFKGIGRGVNEVLSPEFIEVFGLKLDPSVVTAFMVTGIITIIIILIRIFVIPKFKKHPKGFQLFLETLVGFFSGTSKTATHEASTIVGPYICATAIYISVATLAELLNLRPSFASINACLAMGIMTFIVINICAFKKKKLKRFKRYFPNFLNILTDVSVPLSMSLRLFGSILSGYIIMEVLYSMVYTSFIIPAVVAVLTTILHAFLQAYLFSTLTNIFVSEAIE